MNVSATTMTSLLVGLVLMPGAFGIMLWVRVELEDDKSCQENRRVSDNFVVTAAISMARNAG
jgi:hypothetical protein